MGGAGNYFEGVGQLLRDPRRIPQALKSFLIFHFTNTTQLRSEQQVESEKWLIPKLVPFSRWYLMPAAVLIQICCGSLYAWSGYNLAIEEKLYGPNGNVDRAIAVNVFYLAVAMFAISAAIFGTWVERVGPRTGIMVGSTLFYIGQLLTALGIHTRQLWLVFIGFGVIGALGLGISYISPVSPLQKWFIDIRGAAGGLAVCGFGAGSIIAPFTQKALIAVDYGKSKEDNPALELTFVYLGSSYFAIMMIFGQVLRMPPPGYSVKGVSMHTVKGAELSHKHDSEEDPAQPEEHIDLSSHFTRSVAECFRSSLFWMIWLMFLGAEISGLLIISKVQSIVRNQLGRSAEEGASINSVLGGVNLLGRLGLAIGSDFLHTRRVLYCVSIGVQIVCLALLPLALDNGSYAGVIALAVIIGFFYGGGFGMIASFLTDQFGAKNVGATHGVILTAWATAGVAGGLIFSAVYNEQKHEHPSDPLTWYDLNFRWMLAPVSLALILSLILPCDIRDQWLPKAPGETFRFRILNLPMVRFIGCRPTILTKEQEDAEWDIFINKLIEIELHERDEHEKKPAHMYDSAHRRRSTLVPDHHLLPFRKRLMSMPISAYYGH